MNPPSRQDEADAFFGAIESPDGDRDGLLGTTSSSPVLPFTTSSTTLSPSSSPSRQHQQQKQLQDQQTSDKTSSSLDDLLQQSTSSAPPPRESSTSPRPLFRGSSVTRVASPPTLRQQPGMSPAIQKGPVSLGLALGGSGFRRKPLFEPEEDNDEEIGDQDKSSSSAIQELTRLSGFDHEDGVGEAGQDSHGRRRRRSGIEDGMEGEDEEEEDAHSETPLQPHEPIRGL
ncbi:hypothetical protein BGZ95_009427, partial [Linnemannia exigua]